MQLFCCDLYRHGSDLKHQGVLDFTVKNFGSLSPIAFAATPVILILLCLQPEQLSDFKLKVLVKMDKKDQICLYCMSSSLYWKGELVNKFRTTMLSSRVAPSPLPPLILRGSLLPPHPAIFF